MFNTQVEVCKKFTKIIGFLLPCIFFISSLGFAQTDDQEAAVLQQAEAYLANPFEIKPFLDNIIMPPGQAFTYDYPHLHHIALNDMLSLGPKPLLLVQGLKLNGTSADIIANNPALTALYTQALGTLPTTVFNHSAFRDWLYLKSGVAALPKFYNMIPHGNLIVFITCRTMECKDQLVMLYFPGLNRLIGYISLFNMPPRVYIFGIEDESDLAALLVARAFSVASKNIQGFMKLTPYSGPGLA
jgi:hypothetical protein